MIQKGASGGRSLMRLQSSCQPGLWSHLKARLGEDMLPSSLMWVSLYDCLMRCQLAFLRVGHPRAPKMEATVFL